MVAVHHIGAEGVERPRVVIRAVGAPPATPLGGEALGRVPPQRWAQLRFTWHPSVKRLALLWNVPQLWQALTDEGERPPVTVEARPVEWLLWRRQLTTYFRSLADAESAALDGALRGWPFGELCELLCAQLGERTAPAQAAALLRGWVDSGLVIGAS